MNEATTASKSGRSILSRNCWYGIAAGTPAEEAAQNYDDPEYWKANRLQFHLGRKLIDLAVRAVQLEGAPVFELKTSREGGPQNTKTTVSLTDTASDWIAEHQPAWRP